MFAIELDSIHKVYQTGRQSVHALRGVTLRVKEGQVYGIIGQSGAGKSTLLRCINLLERPTEGTVTVAGKRLTDLSTRALQRERARIGMIFQHFHLLQSATVADNVAFPLRLAGVARRQARAKVGELLELVGLGGYEHKYPAQLSGGQKQRVAIARALANDPAVLLCDEATSALDPNTTRAILDLLLDIQRRLGLTIVMVTHEMAVVQRVCDRVAVMDRGQVVEEGPLTEVFVSPRHEVTRSLLEADDPEAGQVRPRSGGTVARIVCAGAAAEGPFLQEAAAHTSTRFSILHGKVDAVKDQPYARLTVEWLGEPMQVRGAFQWLRQRGCRVDVWDEEGWRCAL
ncbi:MAG: ATP-binding cassette domain-containing protein [Alicyclobacillus macrosporangiidus]|uniref:methionine ABC transporter ATP-binding protein n=1 Tax=Alicyclobacillus macrosporangiidus TaxID=392015 RepID=UPI0026F0F895|nr:ATP-binding cassette domain-containing protein [Alicyclobacillus macrosporangiidus]MCL6598081.1 ATP-binding cassette domain-containing protein [Alicyclobacillus macrosporangiidus]